MAVDITKLICSNTNPWCLSQFVPFRSFLIWNSSSFSSNSTKKSWYHFSLLLFFFFSLSHFICSHTLNQMCSTLKIYAGWCGCTWPSHIKKQEDRGLRSSWVIWWVCPPSQMYPESVHFLPHLPLSKSQSSFIWVFFLGRTKLGNSWYNMQNGRNGRGGIGGAEPFK